MTPPTGSPLVVSLGAHIIDVLGRPVTAIPPGQGSTVLEEIRLTAAGTAAGTSANLAKLGARVVAMGAIGTDAGLADSSQTMAFLAAAGAQAGLTFPEPLADHGQGAS